MTPNHALQRTRRKRRAAERKRSAARVRNPMKRLPRRDASGEQLRVGDEVRVVGVPDLSGMSATCQAESLPVFQHIVGTYKRIIEFDEVNMAWLRFKIRNGPYAGHHYVGIEPYLLSLRRFTE